MNITKTDDEITKYSWKKTVSKAVEKKNTRELKMKMEKYAKLDELNLKEETECEIKPYLKSLTMKDAKRETERGIIFG